MGCHSPVPLKQFDSTVLNKLHLNHNYIEQYSKLNDFPEIRHHDIDIEQFSPIPLLHDIRLNNNTTSLSLYNCNPHSLQIFLAAKCWDFNQIKTLKLYRYSVPFNVMLNDGVNCFCDTFCHVLDKFKNINYLELQGMNIVRNDVNRLQHNICDKDHILSNIEGFCFYGRRQELVDFYNILLQNTSHQLISFHVDANIQAKLGFGKLKGLYI